MSKCCGNNQAKRAKTVMRGPTESLDSSIQGALSALFPPFEATAPIVLCQLFRTIEERYHGDALHCLLDFLIPSKHLLESVQQAACASYSDVIFRCEGWPLCLHDKTVIHLAPLNPLLLRPGDFYLQVEPFGEQAARIVLKSLLEEGCREVEETPIPEVSYPCMFTDEWLQEVNEGRHGTPLSRCLLSTDQGVIKLPWAKIAVPEFLDKPKTTPASFPVTHEAPPEPRKVSTPSHYNSSTLPMEAMILPTRDRISVSLRLVEHSSKLVKMERERPAPKTCPKPSIKPVGWVSPNTWDSRNYCEIEGDYVDLVDLDKDKEALGKLDSHANPPAPVFFKPVRPPPPVPMGNGAPCGHTHGYAEEPCTPCSQRKLSYELSDQDLKCRYRDSYMAALANPVAFEKGSVELLAALEEVGLHEQGEFGSKGPISAQGNELGPCGHHYNASEPNNEPDPHKSYCETAANIASHLKDPPVTFKSKKLSRAPRGEDKLTSAQCHKASLPSHEGRRDSKRRSVSDDSNPVLEKCDGNLRPHHKEKHKAKLRSLSTVSESAKGSPILYKLSNRSLSDVCPEMIPNITHHNKHTVFDLVLSRQERHQPPTKGKADLPYIADGSCPKLQKSKVDKPSPPQVRLPSHNLEAAFSPPSQEAAFRSLLGLLQLGIMCLPGGRDKTGRAVVEVHCDRGEWVSPLASAQDLCKLLIYLHSIPRKEVRDLGMTLVIDARKRLPPPHLYKALLLVQEQALHAVHCAVMLVDKDACSRPERQPGLQMDVVTSLKALNKMVDVPQLTSDLSGTFPYSHADWLQFHQRLVSFVADLQGADSLLQRAIKKVNGSKIMDTAQDVQLCIQEQRTLMKEVLQDARLVTLQREGGAVLARIRRELQFQPSEDYRDAVGTVTGLYNQVEEKLHTLVMRSNESLQQLNYLFKLREMEGKINLAGIWFNAEGEQTLKDSNTTDDAPAGTERALQQLDSFLLEAKDKRRQALTLVMEAETIVGMSASSPATDVFRTVVSTFKSNMDDLLLRAEQRRKELDKLVQLYRFCEQATALAKECSLHLEQVEKGCYLTEASRSALKYEDRFAGEFSASHFQAVKARARAVGSGASGVLRSWNAAWIQCQKVRQRLGERHNKNGSDKKQNQRATAVASQRNSGVQKRGEEEEEEEEEERSEGGQSGRFVVQKSPSSTEEVDYSERDVEKGGGSAIEESTGVVPSHPHLKPDLKAIAAGDCERAAGDVQRTAVQPQNGEHVLKSKWRQREHHSEMDLTRVESSGEELLLHQTLGRSLSEGSCASPCLTPLSGSTPLSAKLNHCQVTAQSSQSIENSPVSRNESFCSGNSRCELNTDRKAEERDSIQSSVSSQSPNDSSRQESFNVIDTPTEQSGSYILKLQRIIDELLSTEREYVRALGYIREHYFVELERADVPQDLRGQRGSIFGNLEKLHDFHRHHFLKELESCVREPFRVGRCFLRHRESFALYALYSKNKPRSDSLLINHGQGFFKRKQLELGDKMDLWSYLLKPVQRISKYSLLLQDVVGECSPGQSREMAEVQAALQVVNFQLRHGNNLLAMDDIHHCDVNLKEQGHLIRQDEFLVTFRKKKCFRHIFLFQELVLFSKTKKTDVGNDMYIYKQSFKMSDIGLTHNSGDSGLCFEIWFRRRKSQDTYTLQAACREVKEAWTKDLERILWEQALQNREVRMQERVFMGIGNKPFMDIQPSDAAINSRAVNYVLAHGGTPALRPDSISSERSLTSSSSSGIGSLSSLGYLCGPKQSRGERSSGGYVAPPGVMEEDDLDQESGSHHLLMDSSESSGESVSGFSSSGLSCHSALGGEMEDAPSVAVKEAAQAHPTEAPAHLNKPNGATPPPVAPKPKSLCPTKNLSGGKLRHGNNLLAMDDIHHCDVQSPGKSTDV